MTEANLQAMASSAMGAATMAAKPAGKAASKSSRRNA
jgi:hypothetical protein